MPPEIEVWKRIVIGQTSLTRFYIKGAGDDLWCVTPRSPMLHRSIAEMRAVRQAAADRRVWDEQARRIRVAAQAKQS